MPLTIGFLASARCRASCPIGSAPGFTVGGSLLAAAAFLRWPSCREGRLRGFALIIALNGFGSGLFVSPNGPSDELSRPTPAGRPAA